jgi:putative metallopeptidase DUF4344
MKYIRQCPRRRRAGGITPRDAVLGQTFYVFGHQMGHAMFDVLRVPIFGDAENAADHFSAYMMLQFGKDQAKGLITGAAYSYRKYVQNSSVYAALVAFSDVHAAPAQRFYNMLCLAYGADPVLFAEFVEKDSIEYLQGSGTQLQTRVRAGNVCLQRLDPAVHR